MPHAHARSLAPQSCAETRGGCGVSGTHAATVSPGTAIASTKYTKEQAGHARLMLDALIETVSYEPLAIFMIVAIVLLIMLARTL